ncbi:MAG: dihydroxyacetone kinase subunit DhaL [Tissierellia bacterium]|nr:dihydroxyacetone kinase subunit DhaL [Tissierellia bacterium]
MNITETKEILKEISDTIIENKEYLTELDSAIGDGDHGFNMAKGFKFVKESLEDDFDDYKSLFMMVSQKLISKVGGASGPLYGTFFMKFAMKLNGVDNLDRNSFNEAFKDGVEGVKMRGKAKVGDKTMIDVLEPVSIALNEGKDFSQVLEIAKEKLDYTKEIKANKGRASYIGERSIGHIDPGAMSSYLMLKKVFE